MESLPKSLQRRGCTAPLNLSSRGGTPNGIVCCKEGKASPLFEESLSLMRREASFDAKRRPLQIEKDVSLVVLFCLLLTR